MNTHARTGYKWTVNEILSLQREFELLGWSINQIAAKHCRSPKAIMYKLDQEGFADYNVLYNQYQTLNDVVALEPSLSEDDDSQSLSDDYIDDDIDDDKDDRSNYEYDDQLSKRLCKLESGMDEVKKMLENITSNIYNKRNEI